ncbi:MAG: peptidoglycan-binding protein [Planctomycetes bacterium]|nr:peptidoglycan-binding protein [Planctomycetota bacterium]
MIICEGRGKNRSGAHTAGLNSSRYAWAIADNTMTAEVTDGMVAGMRWLAGLWTPTATAKTIGHQQAPPYYTASGANLNATGCPGTKGMARLDLLQPAFAPSSDGGLVVDPPDIPQTGSGRPVLRSGSRGAAVKGLQRRLITLGGDLGPSGADGIFGRLTEKAVKVIQTYFGIDVDGVVGDQTWDTIEAIEAAKRNELRPQPPAVKPKYPDFPGYVEQGSVGQAVTAVQQRLRKRGWNIAVDGIAGRKTDKVIRSFQSEKGLDVDGVVGPKTWQALWQSPIT